MTDQEFLKLLKDKKVADAYQYFDSSRYKLALARISFDALDKIVNDFFEMGKKFNETFFSDMLVSEKNIIHSDTVNFCGIDIGVSTAINKLTMEILSLLHNFFDTFAQWINAGLLGENALEINKVNLKRVEKEIKRYPEYSSKFISDFCEITSQSEYQYISDFNNILKHRTQIYVQNSINLFTAEGSVAIPQFEKDGNPHNKMEVLSVIESSLKFCEKLLYDSQQFVEVYYKSSDCLYTSHRIYNPKTYLGFECKADFKNGKMPTIHYYYIEVDSTNILKEYQVMLVYDHMSRKSSDERRIDVYNSPYQIIMLREKGSGQIIGIMKPTDGEPYSSKIQHGLYYRKYITQTTDFEQEMYLAISTGEFQYLRYLSDAKVTFGLDESNV